MVFNLRMAPKHKELSSMAMSSYMAYESTQSQAFTNTFPLNQTPNKIRN